MQKISCGTDIIEIERIKKAIERTNGRFINEIFTINEIEYCDSKKNAKYQHYAARFAAKEAIFKAVSLFLKNKFEIGWQNIEVLNDANGRPHFQFIGIEFKQIKSSDISISHCREYAISNVIIEYEEE